MAAKHCKTFTCDICTDPKPVKGNRTFYDEFQICADCIKLHYDALKTWQRKEKDAIADRFHLFLPTLRTETQVANRQRQSAT